MTIFQKLKQKREEKKNRPPEELTVSNKHIVIRIIAFVVLLAVGISGIVIGCTYNSTHLESGWQLVECTVGETSASDFNLYCNFSKSKRENANEMKTISNYYTSLCNNSYKLFNDYKDFEDLKGIAYVNKNPNTDIQVEESLYNVLKKANDSNLKSIFYGPIYDTYHNLYISNSETEAKALDPYYDVETKNFYIELTNYVNNPNHIKITLKENNVVSLDISDEYLTYCNTNNIKNFISLNYFYNAITLDYIADHMISYGIPDFKIYSYDGCYRSHITNAKLDDTYMPYTFYNEHILPEAKIKFTSSISLVELKTFPISKKEEGYYYRDTKKFVHHFLDDSGNYKSCLESLILYKKGDYSLFDSLIKGSKIFTADTLNVETLKENFSFIYNEANVIKYNDSELVFVELFNQDGITFTKELI